jgi:hypothetical protein
MITVEELIDALSQMPKDMSVMFDLGENHLGNFVFAPVNSIDIIELDDEKIVLISDYIDEELKDDTVYLN